MAASGVPTSQGSNYIFIFVLPLNDFLTGTPLINVLNFQVILISISFVCKLPYDRNNIKQEGIKSDLPTNESRDKSCKQWKEEGLPYRRTLKYRTRLLKKLQRMEN